MNRPAPARLHRRAARSILVDTFRRFILPTLKAQLPSAYLPWAASLEIERRLAEFTEIQQKVDALLVGFKWSPRVPLRRFRTCAGSMSSDDSDSDYDATSGCESTPATSVFSDMTVDLKNPHNYLSSVPPVHLLPTELQAQYSRLIDHIGDIAARVQSLKRLNAKFAREEGKRAWLDTLERGRISDKALRRALSNGELTRERCKLENIPIEPMTRSRLWRSWTAADQERSERQAELSTHPAMMEDDSDTESEREDDMPITPTQVLFGRANHIDLPSPHDREPSLSTSASSDSLDEDDVRTPEMSPEPDMLTLHPECPVEPVVVEESAPWTDNPIELAMVEQKPMMIPARSRRRPIPVHMLSAA